MVFHGTDKLEEFWSCNSAVGSLDGCGDLDIWGMARDLQSPENGEGRWPCRASLKFVRRGTPETPLCQPPIVLQ